MSEDEKQKKRNLPSSFPQNAMFALILALITQNGFAFLRVYLPARCQPMEKMCAAAHVLA